jgi:hypothetical protein
VAERRRIGKYEILEEIDRGGFAAVHRAHNATRAFAPKVLHSSWTTNPRLTTCLHCETRATDYLQHPRVFAAYQAGEVKDRLCLAMECLSSCTSRALWKVRGYCH